VHANRPLGRTANGGFSAKEGQAWTQEKVWVFNNDFGTAKKLPIGHFNCPLCDFVVEFDARGYAFCPKCGDIFNEKTPPPKMYDRRNRKFYRSAKA
jgi:hypothetical protein